MTEVTYTRQSRIARIRWHPASGLFGAATRRDLHAALLRYKDDVDAWVAVISSEGANFVRGSAEPAGRSYRERRAHAKLWAGGFVEMWKPTIAAVQGECRGEGLALALGCDLRVADSTATFTADFTTHRIPWHSHEAVKYADGEGDAACGSLRALVARLGPSTRSLRRVLTANAVCAPINRGRPVYPVRFHTGSARRSHSR